MAANYTIECNHSVEVTNKKLDAITQQTPSILPFQRKRVIGPILVGTIITVSGIVVLLGEQLPLLHHFIIASVQSSPLIQQITWPIRLCGGLAVVIGFLSLVWGLAQVNQDELYIP